VPNKSIPTVFARGTGDVPYRMPRQACGDRDIHSSAPGHYGPSALSTRYTVLARDPALSNMTAVRVMSAARILIDRAG